MCTAVEGFSRARVKRHTDMGGAVHMKPAADGRKGGAGHAATSPFDRIADNGGEARGSAHGGYGVA